MTGTGILIAIACLAAGFAVAWAWANSQAGAARLELERRAAGLDGTAAELKKQNDALQQELRVSQKRIEEEQKLRASAEKDAESQRANLIEQRRLLDDAQVKLREAFQSLAGEALKSSSNQFMELAKSKFDSLQKEAEGDLEQRKIAIQVHGGSAGNGVERSPLGSVPRRVRKAGSLRQPAQRSATARHDQQGIARGNGQPGQFARSSRRSRGSGAS